MVNTIIEDQQAFQMSANGCTTENLVRGVSTEYLQFLWKDEPKYYIDESTMVVRLLAKAV